MKKLLSYTFLILTIVLLTTCTSEELVETQPLPVDNIELNNGFLNIEPKK